MIEPYEELEAAIAKGEVKEHDCLYLYTDDPEPDRVFYHHLNGGYIWFSDGMCTRLTNIRQWRKENDTERDERIHNMLSADAYGRAFTHLVVIVSLDGGPAEQGMRHLQHFYYDCIPLEMLNMLIFPVARFVRFQLIPINPNNYNLIEMYKGMYAPYDHSQNPYPPEYWQEPGIWQGVVGAYQREVQKS